jgi:ketosteroid isomerase-like protein
MKLHLPTFFEVVDAGDINTLVEFLTEDAVFRYGSQPPVKGRAAIHSYMTAIKSPMVSHHEVLHTWKNDDSLVVQGEVTLTSPKGTDLRLPFMDVFHLRQKKIYDYRIYIDPTPLFMG